MPAVEHPFQAGTRVLMTAQPGYATWVGLPTLALVAAFLVAGCVGSLIIDPANERALLGLLCGGPIVLGVVFLVLNLFWLTRRGRSAAATVPVFAVFNLVAGVVFMLLASVDLVVGNDPNDVFGQARAAHPALYDAYYLVAPLAHYATAAGLFAGGIGLLLWRPWARRLTLGVVVAELALFVVELPLLVLFIFVPLFDDLESWAGPDEQLFAVAFVVGELALLVTVLLVFLIGQIVVLTRPRVVAAFGAAESRRI